tara:strand:- start:56093 stop:56323 length:231 start_codon:yes stop_codon:yes gene_type:complete
MTAKITALRGPLLNSTSHANSENVDRPVYIEDALIILDGDKIINFGPRKKLEPQLPENIPVIDSGECRIIRSTVLA